MWSRLPRHALTDRELTALEALSPGQRNAAFLRQWVRKEAILKAAGVGLTVDPRSIELTGPGVAPRVLRLPALLGAAAAWTVIDLDVPGHAAALAVDGPAPLIRLAPLSG